MPQKRIHIYYVNKVKDSLTKLANAPNQRSVYANEKYVRVWLDRADILDDVLRQEIIDACKLNNSVSVLQQKGWNVLEGYAI